MQQVNIYWPRRDFRLEDNPALHNAIHNTDKEDLLLPVFILENYMLEANTKFQFGYPSRYFLSYAIPEFAKNFSDFLLLKGKAADTLINLQKELMAQNYKVKIFVNEDIHIDFYKQIEKLKKHKVNIEVFTDMLTVSKNTVSGSGNKYSVFTPFKKAVWKEFLESPVLEKVNLHKANFFNLNILKNIKNKVNINQENIWGIFSQNRKFEIIGDSEHVLDIDNLLDFTPDFSTLENFFYTEKIAQNYFHDYLHKHLANYKKDRDSLEKDLTSKMSLPLAWGLVSARHLRKQVQYYFKNDFTKVNWFNLPDDMTGPVHYLSELIWREFYKYLLYNNPNLIHEEFQDKFKNKINWIEEKEALSRFKSWIRGETGYKVVDAAMMQLAKTGWMHNRARMIVASILTKNLGVDWRWGQEYFRAMLLDLDEASNNGGWQWGASVGADPKPIRIFNPYLQAENYDEKNIYQKKWLGDKFERDTKPIIEHTIARDEALMRYGLHKDANARDY